MRYFSLIPSFVYFAFILMSIGLYLNQGYLVQIQTLKTLYLVSFLGIIYHGYGNYCFLTQISIPKWYRSLSLLIDLILLLSILYFIPSGHMLALYFTLIYGLYVGVEFGKLMGSLYAAILFIGISTILFLQSEVNSAPLLMNIMIIGSSFFIVNILSGLIVSVFDDQKHENEKLQHINSAILNNAPIGFMVTDELGSIISVNPVIKDIFKRLSPDFPLNKYEFATEVLPELRSLDANDKTGISIIRKISDLFIFLKAKVINLQFSHLTDKLFLYVIEDRTEIEKAEMAKRQSEKLAAIGTLAAGIAHEIRNPLTGMSGALQLLEPNLDSEESKKLAKIVYREIDRLNFLITEFLDYSKPDFTPPTDRVALKRILEDCILVIKQDPRFPFLGDMRLECYGDYFVLGYVDKLKQVFLNVLVNAAQAMEASLRKEMKVSIKEISNLVVVEVIDTGVGMSAETKVKIFEPFHTTKPKGTGLGMAIVLKIIELHKGHIFVESHLGQGTKIEIRFPKI